MMIGIIIDTSLIDNNKYNNNCILFFVSSTLSISSRYCVSCCVFFLWCLWIADNCTHNQNQSTDASLLHSPQKVSETPSLAN